MRKLFPRMTVFTVLLATCLVTSVAFAQTNLKQVQVSNGSQVDLLFDGKVGKNQIRTEFFNDVIQIIINDVSVYPAKISSVSEGKLTKVFAYQYAPKLVRCRLTVKGKAEAYKDALQISTSGKLMTVKLAGQDIAPVAQSQKEAKAVKVVNEVKTVNETKAQTETKPSTETKITNEEDRALLDQVMRSQSAPVAAAETNGAAKVKNSAKTQANQTAQSEEAKPLTGSLTGGKTGPNLFHSFGKMILVFGLLGMLLLGVKTWIAKRGGNITQSENNKGIMGALSRFATQGFGAKGKMIEIIATHHIGPKKSIYITKIAGKTLILGVTQENINLISEVENDEDMVDAYGDTASTGLQAPASAGPRINPNLIANYGTQSASQAGNSGGPAVFSEMLNTQVQAPPSPAAQNVRNQIRNRLEGLKPL